MIFDYNFLMKRLIPISLVLLLIVLASCARRPTPEPTPTPTPRPTVPLTPTSTPNPQAQPGMKGIYPVDLLTEDGVPIKGDYYRPLASPAPGVVLLHGVDRTRSDWQVVAWRLMDQGMAVLAIDLRGAGESGGQPQDPNRLADVDTAVAFLRAQAQVDSQNIVLIGENDGSWWALDYAAKHPEIRAVALITPGIRDDKALLQKVMTAYGARPLFLAVSDHPQLQEDHAFKTAQMLNAMAQGPHQWVVVHEENWGIGLLMQENGLAAQLVQWLTEVTG